MAALQAPKKNKNWSQRQLVSQTMGAVAVCSAMSAEGMQCDEQEQMMSASCYGNKNTMTAAAAAIGACMKTNGVAYCRDPTMTEKDASKRMILVGNILARVANQKAAQAADAVVAFKSASTPPRQFMGVPIRAPKQQQIKGGGASPPALLASSASAEITQPNALSLQGDWAGDQSDDEATFVPVLGPAGIPPPSHGGWFTVRRS